MSRPKELQDLVEAYREAGQPWPASSETMAEWAIRNRRWQPSPQATMGLLASQISEALREEYWTDPKGRRARTKHPVRKMEDGRQTVLWDDLRTAPREHMEMTFQQRRGLIVADCRQLKTDVDSFNDFGQTEGRPIVVQLDFRLDVEELEAV
ncbi:MAG: hypothetical protein ACREOQ_14645 [Gemmatimonadales bacterium]